MKAGEFLACCRLTSDAWLFFRSFGTLIARPALMPASRPGWFLPSPRRASATRRART